MEQEETVIRTQGLRRAFKKQLAVNDLNLTIQQGEIFGLVGPDGAGKTTTLRLLAGILRPSDGTASVAGYDVRQETEQVKRRIGYMAQQFSLYPDLTVIENLRFFADVYHVTAAERAERIPRLLSFARLEQFRQRRAEQLSGGMQKKLALACTLIHEPNVIYLDEPTTGVDPVSRREFWDILGDLHLQGITLVVSTPYMDEAERCSRVGLMYDGLLIACDTPDAIQELVPGELLEIHPDPDDISRETLIPLRALPGVQDVQAYGDLLHILVDNAKQRLASIRDSLLGTGQRVAWMRTTPPRMEEAFVHLVRKQQHSET